MKKLNILKTGKLKENVSQEIIGLRSSNNDTRSSIHFICKKKGINVSPVLV